MSDDVIVAIGSVTDCEVLVDKFAKSASTVLNFNDFAKIWKASNFELIFCGRTHEELPQLASELLGIGKNIILNTSFSLAARVGGLYLVFGLYHKQHTKSKVRFTLTELRELMIFLEELKDKNLKEAQFVFYKLFIGNAFLFCTTPSKYIKMNPKRQSEEEVEMDPLNDNECRLIECDGLSMNNLGDIDLLNSKYEEIKTQIPGFGAQNSSSAASDKNFVDQLLVTLNALKSDIERSRGNSAKQGKAMNYTETEENQGIHRRRLVNKSFQSQNVPYRLPGGGYSVSHGSAKVAVRGQRVRENK